MINGDFKLRKLYPDLLEEQYQPAGIDLTVGSVSVLKYESSKKYGLFKDAKVLPKQEQLESDSVLLGKSIKEVYTLKPNESYIFTTNEKIKIQDDAGQFYLPRSSLLRAAIDVRTAFGDPGFNGHLSFLVLNHSSEPFLIEKGSRFAQLIDMAVADVTTQYDGDYNEE